MSAGAETPLAEESNALYWLDDPDGPRVLARLLKTPEP
jgi:hypothetical protein